MNKLKRKHIVLGVILVIVAIVLAVVIGIFIKIKKTFLIEYPELEGSPIEGEWYQVTPDDAIASDGSEWHGIFRKGSENKVIVYFFGGGVSITGETSEGGTDFFATTMMGQDFVAQGGIGSTIDENPFKDWTFIVIPYASGDFHAGTGEYHSMCG